MIDDAFNLASVGLLKYNLALEITTYLRKETKYLPWYAALSGLSYVGRMLKKNEKKNYKVRLI